MAERDNSETATTYTLWVFGYFNIRNDSDPVVDGLTKAQAQSIIENLGDLVNGHLYMEKDEI